MTNTTTVADRDLIVRIHKLGRQRHKSHWETVGRKLVRMITSRRTDRTTEMTQPQAEHLLRMLESLDSLHAGEPDPGKTHHPSLHENKIMMQNT